MGQLSLCATTTEPALQSPWIAATEAHAPRVCGPQQEKPVEWEAHALQLESSPHSPQVQKACAEQLRPSIAINKYK